VTDSQLTTIVCLW